MESPSLEDEGTILLALEDRKFSPNPGGGLAKWGGGGGFLTLFFLGGGGNAVFFTRENGGGLPPPVTPNTLPQPKVHLTLNNNFHFITQ